MQLLLKYAVLASIALATVACRDEPPEDRFNSNLGTVGQPLMPTSLPNLDGAIVNGRATLVSVRDLEELRTADDPQAAIAELIDAFREAYGQGDDDAMILLIVERQRDAVRQTAAASKTLRDAVGKFRDTIDSLDPTPAFHAQVAPMIDAMIDLPLDVANLQIISETEATLPLPPTPAVVGLEKHGDEWLIALPDVDDIDATNRQLAAGTTFVTSLTELLEDTTLTPADRSAKIMQLMADVAAASGAGAPHGDTTD